MAHAIITGGSSGIGREIARRFVARGYRVSLIARRNDVLEHAALDLADGSLEKQAQIHVASADVTSRGSISAAINGAESVFGPCDILVVSAGRVDPAFFDTQSPDAFDAQINLNLIGTANTARAVYEGMKKRGKGKILLISSGAATIGIPGYTAYCASKAALKGFSEALRCEALPFGVSISVAYPPDTYTPQYVEEMRHRPPEANRLMGLIDPWPAAKVAAKIEKCIDRDVPEMHFGFALTMLALFGAFIKPVLYWRALRGGKV